MFDKNAKKDGQDARNEKQKRYLVEIIECQENIRKKFYLKSQENLMFLLDSSLPDSEIVEFIGIIGGQNKFLSRDKHRDPMELMEIIEIKKSNRKSLALYYWNIGRYFASHDMLIRSFEFFARATRIDNDVIIPEEWRKYLKE